MYDVNPDVAPGIPPFSVADMEDHPAPDWFGKLNNRGKELYRRCDIAL